MRPVRNIDVLALALSYFSLGFSLGVFAMIIATHH